MTNRLKIGQEVLIHGYVDEIRYDHTKRVSTVIIRNEGGYFGTVECEVTDIEMPDTNDVLDKIRDEIEAEMNDIYRQPSIDQRDLTKIHACQRHIAIIDKYISGKEQE